MTAPFESGITGVATPYETTAVSRLVGSIAFSHDAFKTVSGSFDNTIRVWEASTGKTLVLRDYDDPDSLFHHGFKIVSRSYDHTIRVWNEG